MTKKGLKSRPSSPSYGGASSRKLEMVVKSSEDVRSSKRLRLQPLRKPKSSQKIKKKKADKLHGKMPKKPPTAFFFFLEDFRKQYQEENPEVKSMREIGKTCGEKWKTMTYEEKVKYYDIATEKREEFHRAMTDYTKRVESGEYDDESETESDFSE
ncbi:High mobility group B protein 14 [Hirschfeldia incana]|nr:High mobility group B protein 14 [Hirschfeldia incana]